MEERMARCTYYGEPFHKNMRPGRNECRVCGERPDNICHCVRSSALGKDGKLAFFTELPDKPYDSFYCGCSGWD